MTTLVSVIVPSYQSVKTLRETVESVLKQSHSDLECLIIDDGSLDGSYELAKELEASDPRIKVLTHPKHVNRGVSASRNLGIDNARGAFIAILDSDDAWLSDKLEVQLKVFRDRPEIGLVFSDTYICKDPDYRLPMADQILTKDESRSQISSLFDGTQLKGAEALFFSNAPYQFIPSPTPIVRAELFRTGLRFYGPPRLNIQYEDFVMWRILALKSSFVALQQPTAIYRVHESSFTGQFQKKKSLLHHLDGLAEVDEIVLTHCAAEIDTLRWREKITDSLSRSYISAVASANFRQLKLLAVTCNRRRIRFKFLVALTQRAKLSVWYGIYDGVRFTKKLIHGLGAAKSDGKS